MNTNPDWRLQGRYFETCNCVVTCPCVWLQPPSESECKLLVAWHIDERADDPQTEALIRIFSGQVGGHLSVLLGFVGKVSGVQRGGDRLYGRRRHPASEDSGYRRSRNSKHPGDSRR